ncbi:hypothetical protein BDW02DRAFT_13421 [Decorospora gaudefroyi]|uniref:Uncharacterized protein n=1 Tax=Decorospora gaudefroyi TaxID=184978 RepID=A0A6A5KTS3_9PLEO|nr:hypothetical protein BDW02DRAFT_13421 [Decorospora gaudefroyi]
MAPSQRDTSPTSFIDLTISSPEPPERQTGPKGHSPPRQSCLTFKPERPQHDMTRVKNEYSQPATSARHPGALHEHQAHAVNPEHVKHIIAKANTQDLQKVLLDLCRVSPAFAGALVRGLALQSTSAQGMINRHRKPSQKSSIQSSDDEDRDDVYHQSIRKRLAPSSAISIPRGHALPSRVRNNDSSGTTPPPPHGSQSVPRVKREIDYTTSFVDSDGELRYPRTAPRPTADWTSLRHIASPSSGINCIPNSALLAKRLIAARKESLPATKTCNRCNEPWTSKETPCIYHPGNKMKQADGSELWNCCDEPEDDPGCQSGEHVTEEVPSLDTHLHRKRPSASPGPSGLPLKRSRAF